MLRWRRPAGWIAFALALAGFGWVLDGWLPPAPRWTQEGCFAPLGFAPNGATFRTCTGYTTEGHFAPVRGWDVQSGREVLTLLADASLPFGDVSLSENDAILAALTAARGERTDELRCINLATGQEQRTLVPVRGKHWRVHPSPRGDFIVLHPRTDEALGNERREWQPLLIFDTQPLRLLARLEVARADWEWTADGQTLLIYQEDENDAISLRRWTRESNTEIALVGAGWLHEFTADHRTLITSAASEDDELDAVVLVWALAALERPGYRPRRIGPVVPGYSWGALLSDNKTMVLHRPRRTGQSSLFVWDLEEQRTIGEISLLDAIEGHVDPRPGGGLFAVLARGERHHSLGLYRARPFAKLWEHRWPNDELTRIEVLADGSRLIAEMGGRGFDVLDVATGVVQLTARLDANKTDTFPESSGAHGTSIALFESHTERPADAAILGELLDWLCALIAPDGAGMQRATRVRVFNAITGAETLRIVIPQRSLAFLSPDGKALLVLHGHTDETRPMSLLCYDVPRHHSWRRILIASLAAGVVLLASRAAWRRLRRRRLSAGAPGAQLAAEDRRPHAPREDCSSNGA
jgi:hypothetical protein